MTSLSAMTPSQSNMTSSTPRNSSATLLLPPRRRNLSWRVFDDKHPTPRAAGDDRNRSGRKILKRK